VQESLIPVELEARSQRCLLYKPSYSHFCLKFRGHGNQGRPFSKFDWHHSWPQNPC